jgi:PAS domain S-box-containing protein
MSDGGSSSTSRAARSGSGEARDAVITVEVDGRVVDLDEGAQRMFGLRRADALGRPAADLLSRGHSPSRVRHRDLAAVLAERPTRLLNRRFEARATRSDGSAFPVELAVARTSSAPARFSAWIRDISEHKAVEAEAARRQAMLAQAEALAHLGSWDWSVRTGELRWSDNLYRLFGLEPGQLTPSTDYVVQRAHPDDRERVRRVVEEAARTGHIGPLDYRILNHDGTARYLQSRLVRVEEAEGAGARLVGSVQDVTEQRRVAQEIAAHIAVSEALAAWESFEWGAQELLRRLGEAMEFGVGVLWLPDADTLVARVFWHAGSVDISEFEAAAGRLRLAPGDSLPGRAWSSRQPVDASSLSEGPFVLGSEAAARARLHGAVAIPAVNAEEVLAVLEFYSRTEAHLSSRLLRSLTGIGYELGHFLARRRGELEPNQLTEREVETLQLAARGMSGPEIAEHLVLSPGTVKTHFQNIYLKWGVSDRASAVAKALRQGLID